MARNAADFLTDGGQMGALMRAFDWRETPVGRPDSWPQSLRTAIRLMLNTRHPVHIIWGEAGTCFYNDAFAPSMGSERHPVALGQPARSVWREVWPLIGSQIEQVMTGHGGVWHENALVPFTREGQHQDIYWTYSYSPIDDATAPHGVGGVLVICTETTAQVLSAQLAAAEIQRQRQHFHQMPGFVAILSGPEHVYQYVNDAYIAIAGARELIGRSVKQVFPELEDQAYFDLLNTVFATGKPFSARAMPIRLAGESEDRFIDLLYSPTRDDAGFITGIFVGGYDVTVRVRAEHALERANAVLERSVAERTAERNRLADIVSNTDIMIMASDFGYNILAINKATADEFERVFGVRPAVGDNLLALLADQPDRQAEVRRAWSRGLAGEEFTYVEEFGDAERSRPFYEVTFRTLRDEHGLPIGCYQFVTDVTQRLREQATLAETQDALRQAQKMEAIGQLTGGLAHDFNNLLLAAQGAAKRAASLTHRLLAFSRRQTLDPRVVNLNRLVSGIEELIRRTIGSQINMEPLVAAGGLWTTRVDPGQMENALLNLCINARDAMPNGGQLTIETGNAWFDERMASERDLAPGHYVRLCVSDTGTGMTPEVMARAFDPFFTTKPIGMGTGLGLSMIHGFVKQSGGHVRIYSELGKGTMVCLYLPRHLGDAADIETGESSAATAPPATRKETVRVVDDEPTVRMLVSEVLNDLGYSAIEAENGIEGLKILESRVSISLLISDVGLPGGLNGRQMADAARVVRPDLKVLFITGYAENAVLSHGHLGHGMHVLTKPFAMEELARRIQALIITVVPGAGVEPA